MLIVGQLGQSRRRRSEGGREERRKKSSNLSASGSRSRGESCDCQPFSGAVVVLVGIESHWLCWTRPLKSIITGVALCSCCFGSTLAIACSYGIVPLLRASPLSIRARYPDCCDQCFAFANTEQIKCKIDISIQFRMDFFYCILFAFP